MDTDSYLPALLKAAQEGVKNAFVDGYGEESPRFGAAVLTTKGNIFFSGQYFSDTLTLTLHAEQGALAHAAAHGEYEIAAITCIGNQTAYKISGGIIYPCHLCKQLLWESHLRSGVNTEVYILDVMGSLIEKTNVIEIMKHNWPTKIHHKTKS